MDKVQQLAQLFKNYDTDNDGELSAPEVYELFQELGTANSIYPGSVNKMVRKMNYQQPEKQTLNFDQTKQYYLSFESESKHDLWKAKYTLYEGMYEVRTKISEGSQNEGAAPGASPSLIIPEKTPQNAKITILVGQKNIPYKSEIDFEFEKVESAQIPKPFVKLTIICSSHDHAKKLEASFKQNFSTFLKLLGDDIPDWKDEVNKFHLNAVVQDVTATFFITTSSEEMIELIKIFSQGFEISFSSQLKSSGKLRFQFDYDFEDYVKIPQSSFYDIMTKNNKLQIDFKVINLLKAIKDLILKDKSFFQYNNESSIFFPVLFLNLDKVNLDLEFGNSQIQQHETATKYQLNEGLKELKQFFAKLDEGGMKIKELLALLDGVINLEAICGEWKIKLLLKLKNWNKILLQDLQEIPEPDYD